MARLFPTIICFLLLAYSPAFPQSTTGASLADKFEELKQKSTNYEDYEVVKNDRLNGFWKEVTDSLVANQKQIAEMQEEMESVDKKIAANEQKMAAQQDKMDEAQYLIDHMHVLGIPMGKNAFMYGSFFLILALLAILVVGFQRFGYHQKVAAEKKRDFEDMEGQLMDLRNRSREKEMRLRRDLQTEINRVEDLKQELSNEKSKR